MSSDTKEPIQALLQQQQDLLKQWINAQTAQEEPAKKAPPLESRDMARVAAILASQTTDFLQFGNNILDQIQQPPLPHGIEETLNQFRDYVHQQTGEALLKQWQLPENIAALFHTHSVQDDMLFENPYPNGLKGLLNLPSTGASHEFQQNIRDGIKFLLEYQEALGAYIQQYSQINQNATQALLIELTEGSKIIETLGELHDTWVDCYEHAYSDLLYTAEYQGSHGRISNAIMQLRKYSQDIRDTYFEATGLVTRKGLDTALQRQHTLRKEMRQINRTLTSLQSSSHQYPLSEISSAIKQLSEDVSNLRDELTKLTPLTVSTTMADTDEKS
ncbi:poly(R)-hydroxyalkanoic acid synthase subunit PhaE [Neptunomonas antarctica]|uniref:Poly(3-hydroxyalkanoate) polymerase subunit PhaE n=1 Tax=Neptunomonas antarctica TaxID=619304 RepID=A0A1N7JY91_9GAMM|nr:poly(R)-hydroxyalkanoic acid synthase subunit PhaE [Neptunomonas antarctica]SIS54251.1 poly(R)-hydroxyalkanoic acid synthase, class III, PhaE subunit [Neptunomonas antarctica]